MSDELEVDDDIFLEEGVFYCVCGTPVEAEEAKSLIEKEEDREFISCPSCELKHFAETGKFRLDEE